MASTFSPSLKLTLMANGDQSGTWGSTTNTNLGTLLEQAIVGVQPIVMVDADYTLTNFNGASDEARNAVLVVTGTNSAIRNIITPSGQQKTYIVSNGTAGGFAINIKAGAGGIPLAINSGITEQVYTDGTNFYQVGMTSFNGGTTGLTPSTPASGDVTLGGTLNAASGGTGLSSPAANSVLLSNGSSALQTVAPGTSGYILTSNGTTWVSAPNGGIGVSSVGLSAPSIFTVTGSPVTSTGTLTLSYSGSPLPVANGGTGLTSFTSGGAVYATSTSALTTGTLPIASGGTNSTATPTAGTVAYGTGTAIAYTSAGTAGQALISNGTSTPSWGTVLTSTNATLTGTTALRGSYGGGAITSNFAAGDGALVSNTTGSYNTASGVSALYYNTTGSNNTASGYQALYNNTTGNYNTASGASALYSNTTGAQNTASGTSALQNNTTGSNNTASGVGALYNNTTGNYNTASGASALYSNTTGIQNTASGVSALFSNTTGVYNTASGYQALYNNTAGSNNTASGLQALFSNTTGSQNTASGASALYYNTTGYNNTASGMNALFSNSTGSSNTASGASALEYNTTGTQNTASSAFALYNNTTGAQNTASGAFALTYNTTGSQNTASGMSALTYNTTGIYNTASGYQALYSSTTGNYNTASGANALYNNTTGSGNTAFNPLNSAGTYAPVFDPSTQNNRICMGSTGVTNAYIQVAWTVVSDARDKTNFAPVPHGLDFVNQLQPTAYQFKEDRETDVATGIVRYGFKAQDILALEGDTPVIIDIEDLDKLKFNSDSLIPVLVNAIKELSAKITALEAK